MNSVSKTDGWLNLRDEVDRTLNVFDAQFIVHVCVYLYLF